MSQINPTGLRTFTAGEALEAYRRVKFSAGSGSEVVYSDADDDWIGTTEFYAASGAVVTVKMRNVPGTRKMIFASSASAGARVYAAADGKVDDVVTGGKSIGKVLDAPGAAGIAGDVLLEETADNYGLLAVAIASSTAITAAGPTTFSNASKTIDGTILRAGDLLRIKAAGILTTATGTETTKVDILVGTEIVMTTGAVDSTSADMWRLEADVVVRVAGASGKLQSHGHFAIGAPGTIQSYPYCGAEVSEDLSDTTLPILCQVTNSSTGESVLCHSFSVELLRQ